MSNEIISKSLIAPGDIYQIDRYDNPPLYFLCTSADIADNGKIVKYYGYTNIESTNYGYPNGLNIFNFNNSYMNNCHIVYSSPQSIARNGEDTSGWLQYLNDINDIEYHDNKYTQFKSIKQIGLFNDNIIHEFYKLKDRCMYYDYHLQIKNDRSVIAAGNIYRVKDSNNSHINCIMAIRKCVITNTQELGIYFINITNDGYITSSKIRIEDIYDRLDNNKLEYIGFCKPDKFQLYFDVFHAYGNLIIYSIDNILMTE